ncbi:MAG: hypothetical protein EXQ81_02185 [Thermoleophilia bacterium]|nr:hypothetical protein [Thermoleophilia bacterium]
MSALAFLSPGAAHDAKGFHPVARSPLDRRLRDAGASFEERDGWLVPVSVPGEAAHLATVGVTDLSHLSVFEVRPAEPTLELDGVITHRLSARRALVFCPPARAAAVREALGDRFVLDLSGAFAIIAFAGPEAETVLRRITHLHHLPASGEIAHINGHVLAPGGTTWVVCPQESGHYLWEVILDRASALGGGPVGVDALARGGSA